MEWIHTYSLTQFPYCRRYLIRAYKETANCLLEKVDRDVLSANGSDVEIYDQAFINLVLHGTALQHEILVADIYVDVILGLDFLVKYEVILNMRTQKVAIWGIGHPIQFEDMANKYKIAQVNRRVVPLDPKSCLNAPSVQWWIRDYL